MKEKNKELWEDFYRKDKYIMWYPSEQEIAFLSRLSKEKDLVYLNGLDLGCGNGRHTILMKELGIDSYGLEISKNALELAKLNAISKNIFPKFSLFDGEKIQYKNDFFDIIISHGVLDHMKFDLTLKLMKEMKRILKKDGHILLIIHSYFDMNYGRGEKIDENTFIINWDDLETGLPQHYFTEKEIRELVKDFSIERIFLWENKELDKDLFYMKRKDSFWVLYLKNI